MDDYTKRLTEWCEQLEKNIIEYRSSRFRDVGLSVNTARIYAETELNLAKAKCFSMDYHSEPVAN